ncbi:MAG: acetyl-CoA carboxylase carboxyltransferase subunit alpha [Oscillospiraceae bacterium]|nr:acetyl-CoA carboxylase carboxyltransferase subunit alpha [Oscillospiraceae bacterium]
MDNITEGATKEMTATEKKVSDGKARDKKSRERDKKAVEKVSLEKTPYDFVKGARSKERLTSLDFIKGIFTGFIELHGDRRFADDPAVVGGVAYLGDVPFTVLATEKGRDTRTRIKRNFGAPNPEGYRKSLRLMKQAEKFNRPVVCFVDTSGAFCGIGAEERGQGQAIAENILTLMTLQTPVLSILIGEGGSGGALALAVADEVWMLENAVYSVISPEGCANILWRDPDKAAEAAQDLKLTAEWASALGVVDKIISEKSKDPEKMLKDISELIENWYKGVCAMASDELTQKRYERFRKIGL